MERPKKNHFSGSIYNEKELEQLFEVSKGKPIELGIILAAFYGLRRSEAVGLKWSAIDFEQKTISIRHTVTQVSIDGKSVMVVKDRTKTKSSYRSLPLVPPFEELLNELKAKQELNKMLCGRAYCSKDAEYIYVNDIGELVKPGFINQNFPNLLEKNDMRKIRYHDLRHSCASLLYANGVSLERDSRVVRTQRYFHDVQYLYPLGFQFKGCIGERYSWCLSGVKQKMSLQKDLDFRRDIAKTRQKQGFENDI